MSTLENISVSQLRKLVAIKQKIERLQAKLEAITGGSDGVASTGPKRRGMSAAGKARIAAAQRRRWAKLRAGEKSAAPARKGRRKVSAATRARLAASAKARWAKAKAAGKSAL
jgi:hypothetical protein